MSSNGVPIRLGDQLRFRLRGQRGSYDVEAAVIGVHGSHIDVRLTDERTLRLPLDAIENWTNVNSGLDNRPGPTAPERPVPACIDRTLRFTAEHSFSEAIESQLAALLEYQPKFEQDSECDILDRTIIVLRTAMKRLNAESYREAEEYRFAFLAELHAIKRAANPRSRRLEKALTRLRQEEALEWGRYTSRFEARPHILTDGTLGITVPSGGEFELPIRIALDNAYMPARDVSVVIEQHRGLELVGHTPVIELIEPGGTRTVYVRMKDRRRQGARDDIRIEVKLTFAGTGAEVRESGRQRLTVRLRRAEPFEPIGNPFRQYASGIPVDEPGMFFGREQLITDIVTHLLSVKPGRCFGLYGQKRTGKSSVVEQVRLRLADEGILVASVSMGVVDRSSITASFFTEVLDQLRSQVGGLLSESVFARLLTRWPDSAAVAREPLNSFRKAIVATRALLRADGEAEPRLVIVVDEFTYLFEILRRSHVSPSEHDQLRDFMRQWKSLIEARLFSALVVGQDSMPYFIDAFPNEFSVMQLERLEYLTTSETETLADRPILRIDGSSRFVGYALHSIPAYTDGHPFFTQILCDRVVTIANERKNPSIAQHDVEEAVESLLAGRREIGMYRFDCLLTADNTGMLLHGGTLEEDPTPQSLAETASRILTKIAADAGAQNAPVDRDRLDMSVFELKVYEDLLLRQVITERNGRVHIRIVLFAEYLRRRAR
ncbi:AAA family ATPase [Mumia qirimensis]|uniref:AAA family ATPase n=1 Tax=Mumia qirimensis TaxID=3234852 RepID=UPI00351D3768